MRREKSREEGQVAVRVIYLIGARALFPRSARHIFSPCFSFGTRLVDPFVHSPYIHLRPFYTPLDLPTSATDKHATFHVLLRECDPIINFAPRQGHSCLTGGSITSLYQESRKKILREVYYCYNCVEPFKVWCSTEIKYDL